MNAPNVEERLAAAGAVRFLRSKGGRGTAFQRRIRTARVRAFWRGVGA